MRLAAGVATETQPATVQQVTGQGTQGGAGVAFDWRLAGRVIPLVANDVPVMVAGGLTPETVSQAVAEVLYHHRCHVLLCSPD
jgi:phosphoribosylanthranilate isomerase